MNISKIKGVLGELLATLDVTLNELKDTAPEELKQLISKSEEEIKVMVETKDPTKFSNIQTLINNARHQHNQQKNL